MNNQYAVLNPWAEADPIPLKGITSRLNDLSDRKIGMFCNFKPAANPIMTAVRDKLRERYPVCELIWYNSPVTDITELAGTEKKKFEDWANSVDAVVLAVGD